MGARHHTGHMTAGPPSGVPLAPYANGSTTKGTCTAIPKLRFPSNIYGTWYGVQTDGPTTAGVVDIDMWERNAADIVQYMNGSPIAYNGLLVHVEPPTAAQPAKGKPANAYAHVYRVAHFICTQALGAKLTRVGLQATVEADATWVLPAGVPAHNQLLPTFQAFYDNDGYWGKWGRGAAQTAPCGPGGTCAASSETCVGGARCIPNSVLAGNGLAKCGSAPPDVTASWHPNPSTPDCSTSAPSTCWCVDGVTSEHVDGTAALLFDASSGGSYPPGASFASGVAAQSTQWYGGAGAVAGAASVQQDGSPYQVLTAASFQGAEGCPYKLLPGMATWPQGCPNNMYHLGWYTALLNYYIRRIKGQSTPVISMMNWDAEDNGPDGQACSIFQFLYAIREFGTLADVLPNGGPWMLLQHCGAGAAAAALKATNQNQPCYDWRAVDINLNPKWPRVTSIKTFGDMAQFVPSPEYYWFQGQDMGAAGPQTPSTATTGRGGMLRTLLDAGYLGCPQSESAKPGFDGNCGCRATVYDTYAYVDDGGEKLISDVFGGLYTAANTAGTAPTFSIEHLGDAGSMLDFGRCINSQNFSRTLANPPAAGDTLCAADTKCTARCGVANFFGNWSETCFQQFLYTFINTYGSVLADPVTKQVTVLVYDVGFVPSDWFQSPHSFAPGLGSGSTETYPTVAQLNATPGIQGVVDWLAACPQASKTALARYACPSTEPGPAGPYWKHSSSASGNPVPAGMQCYDCKAKCGFAPNVVGGIGANNRYYPTQGMCATSPCGSGGGGSSGGGGGSGSGGGGGGGGGSGGSGGSGGGPACARYEEYFGNDGYWGKYGKDVQPVAGACGTGLQMTPTGLCAPSSVVAACAGVPYPTGPFVPEEAVYCSVGAAAAWGVRNPQLAGPNTCWCVSGPGDNCGLGTGAPVACTAQGCQTPSSASSSGSASLSPGAIAGIVIACAAAAAALIACGVVLTRQQKRSSKK